MYQRRLCALRADPNVRYGMLFKNVGARAGASQEHAHSQILGVPILPAMVAAELDSCRRDYEATGTGLFQQLIESELANGERLAGESEHFVAICPFASRFPCEFWILPKTGEPSFPDHPPEQIRELGTFAKSLLVALETMLPEPAYNYFLHTAPFDGQTHLYYHWHLEVTPRIVGLAGFELGSGMFINPIPPEWAAQQIRQRLSQA
jgi:UDPglucose--hexose-1-phosphate uridylyltransferase